MESKHGKELPNSTLAASFSYNQTYIVLKQRDSDAKRADGQNEVLFRCGNWCYQGFVQFNNMTLTCADVPVIIPTLQRQQGSLRYYCNANSIPHDSVYFKPFQFMFDATDFLATEVSSEQIEKELRKWSTMYSWIDENNSKTYFELSMSATPEFLSPVALIVSKTYIRDLVIMSIFHENSIYFMIQSGEGDQPLLDVRFPDVSKHGQGLQLACYTGSSFSMEAYGDEREEKGEILSDVSESKDGSVQDSAASLKNAWKKLTLWHILDKTGEVHNNEAKAIVQAPKLKTFSISSGDYQQTYCIMKSSFEKDSESSVMLSMYHDVMFRFGSWCYAGRVQLIPSLSLSDVPFVIPALRMQQSRLDFYCETSKVPINSPFARVLEYINRISPIIEDLIVKSSDSLAGLIDRLSRMGLGDSVKSWLEGNEENSFFEFQLSPDTELERAFEGIELICSKAYHASGIVTITIFYQFSVFVCVLDASHENPLLDSKFPDVSGKGRGYQIQAYGEGVDGWPQLRKVSVWQTATSLEQEFREKAAKLVAESKAQEMETKPVNSVVELVEEAVVEAKAEAKTDIFMEQTVDVKSADSSPQKKAVLPSLTETVAVARPHHLPKLEGLSKKLEDIRRHMPEDLSKTAAPWDLTGKPLKLHSEAK